MSKKNCPELFIKAGASSVYLRHLIEDGAATKEDFYATRKAFEATIALFRENGIARMEAAAGELDFLDAEKEYFTGDKRRAFLLCMRGHDSWRAALDRHGIDSPTDDQIKDDHRANESAMHRITATLTKLAAGNLR